MASIEDYLKKIVPLVDKEIEAVFPRKITAEWLEYVLGKPDFAFDTETLTKSAAEPIWEYLDRGGKRWRPALAILACEAVGGSKELALKMTPLVELIHNGTIMVDDIEDNSETRRGKPCTHIKYGNDIAINDGNLMYFAPLTLLYKNPHNLSAVQIKKIYELYSAEMIKVSFGQAMDIWWHKGEKQNVSEQEYLQMCVYKTGVLARFAAKLGAITGNATQEQEDALGKFAETVGVSFQIQDDILNLVGEEFQKGKGVGEDIHEGKRTIMVLHALKNAGEKEKKRLIEILNSHPESQKTIRAAIEIIKKTGAIDYAREKARAIVKEAWEKLEPKLSESEAKKMLKEFADYLIERKI
ncbi:MAG: polyprenyl synthetase family protein [Candidatus Diapherotrites archaeon]|nr:polyprenyl synthetase family protein [Candidatus Diapherotrites archaeon]